MHVRLSLPFLLEVFIFGISILDGPFMLYLLALSLVFRLSYLYLYLN